jgi:glycosyltransferase involved in cell wall biosynthesis
MKIAMFSPLPPKKTGVALYTKNMVHSLKNNVEIDLFDTDYPFSRLNETNVYDYASNKVALGKLHDYDLIVYHIGNNPHFHLSIYKVLSNNPGAVILHDAVIYFLIAGQNYYAFIKDFFINYGFYRMREISKIKKCCAENNLLTYPHPERYPLLKTVINNAKAIIVHSQTAKNIVLSYGYKNEIYLIPFLIYQDVLNCDLSSNALIAYRQKLNIKQNDIVIGLFGLIGQTGRFGIIFKALAKIKKIINFKLLRVGAELTQDMEKQINQYDLQDNIISTGYLESNNDYFSIMNLSDFVINLRYPSMGETSSILTQAMFLAKACIVTNDGWFSELPDDVVLKIPYGEAELEALIEAILTLSRDKEYRDIIGQKASRYVLTNCFPEQVGQKYQQIFHAIILNSRA